MKKTKTNLLTYFSMIGCELIVLFWQAIWIGLKMFLKGER